MLGDYFDDGFSTILTFSLNPSLKFKEIEVTPPGIEGGMIETSSMRNTAWHTLSPKTLKRLTPVSSTGAYQSASASEFEAMVNQNQEITVTLPDGESWSFWGAVTKAEPGANVEGERPTLDLEIVPSLTDNDGNETAPTFN